MLGTTEPIEGEPAPRPPLFPNAKLIAQRREWDTFASLHPMQWAWYVDDGIKDLITDNVVLVDGDVELGKGVALVWTPGHTDGNHSLCVNTPDGVWVSSENGVAADTWHPHLSKIPGVRRTAELLRPRGDPQLEHARGLDRPVRLDDQGEGARRPEPARPALPQRLPVLGDGRLEAPVAGGPDLLLRRDQLRRDRAPPRPAARSAVRRALQLLGCLDDQDEIAAGWAARSPRGTCARRVGWRASSRARAAAALALEHAREELRVAAVIEIENVVHSHASDGFAYSMIDAVRTAAHR